MEVFRLLLLILSVTLTLCQNEAGSEGDLTLVGGIAPGTGTVLIYHDGKWGKICDDGWNLQAAHVICKSLAYGRALMAATKSHFGGEFSQYDFWMDDVRCYGHETSISACEHEPWGRHNCDHNENAGVFCLPPDAPGVHQPSPPTTTPKPPPTPAVQPDPTTTTTTTTTPATPVTRPPITATPTRSTSTVKSPTTTTKKAKIHHRNRNRNRNDVKTRVNELINDDANIESRKAVPEKSQYPINYPVRLTNGRTLNEGLVEVKIKGKWGVICGDGWTLMEATVVCKQTGYGYGHTAMQVTFFGGTEKPKLLGGLSCEGDESTLSSCFHSKPYHDVVCSEDTQIAGVICATELPDLVPNATLVQESTYLQDRPMYYLQCALEENCASPSAFTIRDSFRDWHIHRRRLLRFSSSTWNFGTADFRPKIGKESWEWHLCHMHYHSMSIFAHYDIMDLNHNRIAEGHKASFCLEDVQCIPEKEKKFQCKGFGDQGISVGCADDYLHDIDCQWIDITDVVPGNYIFKIHVNPEKLVAELDFNNNAVTCDLTYTGYDVTVKNCKLGRG